MGNDWLSPEQRRLLERMLDEEGVDRGESPIIARPGDRSALPLSFAQQRMWFFHRLQPGSTMYNIVGAAQLRGSTDQGVLQRCVDELVRRHEVLRSTFHLSDGGDSIQRVNPPSPVPMPFADLRALAPAERDEAVQRRYREEIDHPFDLTRDLLLRPTLLRVADDEHLLLLSQHHIATDGWSLGILLQELSSLYEAYSAGRAPTLAEPSVQYGDFALWQQEWQATGALDEHLTYWRERLTGAHALDLPTGKLRPAERTWDGGCLEVRMPPELVGGLKALGESERATLFMVLLAGVSTVLSRWTGQQDLVIGVPVANRNRGETETMVGSFVNTLPMRVELTGRPTFREFLRHVRQQAVDGYAHQDVPFEKIIEEINPEREASAHTPLIRHMLGLHNTPQPELSIPGLTVDIATLDTGKARFDLEFELTPTDDGGISGQLWFAADIMDTAFVERLLTAVHTVLAGALADPDTPLWRLPMCPATPTPAVAEPVRETIFDLYVEQSPDAPAVRAAGAVLTVEEFRDRIDRVARGLREQHGVGPGTVVATCLPPSVDLPVVLLATLAAGAVALPLDPSLGRDETAEAVRQCAAAVVLTEQSTVDSLAEPVPDGDPLPKPAPDDPAVYVRSRDGELSLHSHANLAARVRHLRDAFPLEPGHTVAVSPQVSPDLLITALLWPLSTAGCVVLGDTDDAVDVLLTNPARLEALTGSAPRRVLTTGEQLWPDTVAAFARAFPDSELVNVYSLAEAGPVAAMVVDPAAEHPSGRIPVGAPLGTSGLEVLDELGQPVPVGVAGDLHVTGPSLATGHRNLPTGDRARWITQDSLEILGRPAGRIMVHGRPAELGDLVSELTAHPAVARAHFSVTDAGELIAHAVPERTASPDPEQWRDRFAQDYLSRDPESDPILNLAGWHSPRSGEDLPASAMREWADAAVRQVLDAGPRRVLEIGCRNGQLLFRLAPRCDAYQATELSARARKHIEGQRDRLAAKAEVVEVFDRAPDDFTGLADDLFDTVVVNGLVGYCPDTGYLERVLAQAVRVTRPGGTVFVSDVPDLTGQQAIHLPSEVDRTSADAPISRLREAVARRAATTDGLALHPDFFRDAATRLPGVHNVAVLRRITSHPSELTRFRFDVVLHVGQEDTVLPPVEQVDWSADGLTVDRLGDRLRADSAPELLVLKGIPIAGLTGLAAALDLLHDGTAHTVGELANVLNSQEPAVDPAVLLATANAAGYDVVAGPSGHGFATLSMALRRQNSGPVVPLSRILADAADAEPAVGPLAGDLTFAEWARTMPAVLRGYLRDRLPLNVVPASVEPLTTWPRRPDGRVDDAAFSSSDEPEQVAGRASTEPRTPTEKTVQGIWADILGVDHLGVHDDFFALGGHSLMGAAVIDRLRDEFQLDLPLGQLFQTPTVAEVAQFIDEQGSAAQPEEAPAIRAIDRSAFRRKRPSSTAGADR